MIMICFVVLHAAVLNDDDDLMRFWNIVVNAARCFVSNASFSFCSKVFSLSMCQWRYFVLIITDCDKTSD